jgi:D-beta-D-heptose 7-phosphate kinase/D-beta-D-heptose 1-phosphate adenosyltransferase
MLDIYHYGTVDRISPEAPVPIFASHNTEPEYRLGGACNTALNLAKLGVETSLFGFIGKDVNASYILSYLSEYEIDYHLFNLSGFPTITKNRYFSKNQQIIRIDQEDTDGNLYNKEDQDQLIKGVVEENLYHAIIISDYGKGAVYHPVLNNIMSYCSEKTPIFVDPKLTDWGHYEGAFCITPNWQEFRDACHAQNMKINNASQIEQYAGDQCRKHNIDYILITLGSNGMILIDKKNHSIAQAAESAEIYDVSGAGDTVIAMVAAAYCKNYPMNVCMQLATMAAKIVIGKLGTYAITNEELYKELLEIDLSGKECE